MAENPFYLTDEGIDAYYRAKLDSGVSPVAVKKYRNSFRCLVRWLGENRELTGPRLQAWRQFMESSGYSKQTVQNHISVINTFLRAAGRSDLCIPKPLQNDLRGKTFGYITALEPTEKRRRRDIVWKCQCRCGKELEVPATMLLRMNTTSCGCLKQEILQHANRYEEGTALRQSMTDTLLNPNSASGYVGVSPKRDKWAAYITYKKKTYYLGTYSKLEDAVRARAGAKEAVMEDAARIYEETDYLYGASPGRPTPPEKQPPVPGEPVRIPARRSNNTSGYPGVTRSKGKWTADITVEGRRYRLGAYDDMEAAVAVRKRAEELVRAGDLETLKGICTNRQK